MTLVEGNVDLVEFSIFTIGLIFGSFLNVLIYRLPLSISLFDPKRSICPNCNTQIKWYENIPLLSYSLLKGKCSNCDIKISYLYPFVELLTATITLLIYSKLGLTIDFIIITMTFYTFIVLSFIDFKYKAVPDYLLIIAILISIFYAGFDFIAALTVAGAFSLLELFITYYIQNIKYKLTQDDSLRTQKSLGEGDIPIVAIIGGVLGIKFAILAIVFAAFFAIIASIYYSILKKEIEIPFIPFLSLGFFSVFYFSNLLGDII